MRAVKFQPQCKYFIWKKKIDIEQHQALLHYDISDSFRVCNTCVGVGRR